MFLVFIKSDASHNIESEFSKNSLILAFDEISSEKQKEIFNLKIQNYCFERWQGDGLRINEDKKRPCRPIIRAIGLFFIETQPNRANLRF